MAYNIKKMSGKRPVAFLLVLSIVSSAFYLPVFTPRTQALSVLGTGDDSTDFTALIKRIIDGIAMSLAQRMVDDMVKSTVKWANSGFDGNPAYVTDPQQFFTDSADRAAISYLQGTRVGAKSLNLLCSPFQAQVRLALTKHQAQEESFQCTLSGIVANIDAFYNNFNQGGWDGWFAMTQNSSNNPYGAYLDAQIELDSRIAQAISSKEKKLDLNQGFLSWEECKPEYVLNLSQESIDNIYGEGSYKPGDCYDDGSGNNKKTVTPGSTLKAQLDKVLPSGMERLISVQHMEQLVSSFANGLLTRYVFGPKGLFTRGAGSSGGRNSGNTASGNNNRSGTLDLDSDGIPDGQDSDFDGVLWSNTDICYHGGTATSSPPGCTQSSTATSSPYFTPICQAIDGAVASLTEYTKFIDKYADQLEDGGRLKGAIIGNILMGPVGAIFGGLFGHNIDNFKIKANADIWANRTSEANSAVEEILDKIRSRNSSYFDDIEFVTNRFTSYISNVLESLIRDKDLDLARRGNGGGGLENLMKHTAYNLRYFKEVKTRIGKCETPNISAVDDIPLPPEVGPLEEPATGEGEAANNSVIWGYVFEDTNGNGVLNTDEPKPSNVSVHLKSADGTEDLGTSLTYNGIYTFIDLANGQSYIVGIDAPAGYRATQNNVSVIANPLVPNQPVKNFPIVPEP